MPVLSLRPITVADLDFLNRLYASTRQEELAQTGWSAAQISAFLSQQFQAQHRHYQQHYADAYFDLILVDEDPIGRFYLADRADEYRLIDIALLPACRNQGIGSRLLGKLLRRAGDEGKAVRLHVEHFNPARHWYQQLGFKLLEDKGIYHFMEWSASPSETRL